MANGQLQHIAVIGAGLAGAACARALLQAGHAVQVFDKSRGPGGRLATRRLEWVDRSGQACTTRLDHGAVGITAQSPPFRAFVDQALQAGWLRAWSPRLGPDSLPLDEGLPLQVPAPDMPALCRHLLQGAATHWRFAVDRLHHSPLGWQLAAGGVRHDAHFDTVVLAIPPAQAAPLLQAHRDDWARRAALAPMQPCWTLMGVADAPVDASGPAAAAALVWDLARPPSGPLAFVVRNDARPGRAQVPGQAHWVVHARAGWSRRHLEQTPAWVQQQLQRALADYLDQPVAWQHCTVHRWRYALPAVQRPAAADVCWWDADRGLGVCGDFLGGSGVEGAWLSAQALSSAVLRQRGTSAPPPPGHRLVA